MKDNQRTPERIRFHYEVEKELAGKLRAADRKERMHLYSSVYNELFTRVTDHPQIVQKASLEAQQQAVNWQIKLLKPLLSNKKTFMEIGSGDCSLSFAATKYAKYVYAVDVSEEIARNAATPKNFNLVISDGISIPVQENSIDVCYSNQLMEHLHPDDAFDQLKNIYTALSEGGKYLCITPNKLAGPHDVSKYFDREATGFHLKEYTIVELNRLFKKAGFSSTKAMLSFKNNIWTIPVEAVGFMERALSIFPYKIRRKLALNPIINRFLGIYIVGCK
ncbi:hypothetical protein C900_02873 [Fulvivirga imtechensis AK7]|uniref:Methyltransferase type 11 domain-containing protein n=1 Tax=Fulvivirga imtechensis AK7 TaxID=1237149 RepID=L8JSV3_9BACT|nr:class I SAM-dependent methyltransferase [Fulvivirga imtechensis]ELR71258.1 hypothetical protein C900_02873 [Fulvivirga imtechensis AK7]